MADREVQLLVSYVQEPFDNLNNREEIHPSIDVFNEPIVGSKTGIYTKIVVRGLREAFFQHKYVVSISLLCRQL